MFGESRMESHPVFHKTQLCKFHMMGRCTRWKACKFAHGEEELQPLPDFSRTKLCPELCDRGRCTKGSECAFAHTLAELRSRRGGCGEGRAGLGGVLPVAPRPGAAPARPSRAADAEAPPLPPPPLALTVEPRPAPLVVLLAPPVPVQVVQVVQMPCVPLPAAAPSGCDFVGSAFVGEAATGPPQRLQEEPSNLPDIDIGDDFFDVSCEKDEELDLPGGSWSRQSTEDGALLEPPAEFSRQGTEEEAWEPLPAEEAPPEEPRREGAADVDDGASAGASAVVAYPSRPSFREAAASLGLEFAVKHTFIKFNDQAPLDIPLRRARSTGEFLFSAC